MKKVKKYLVEHNDGESVVHWDGCFSDVSLCGHDLSGDESCGWKPGVETKKKVDCEQCLMIIEHVKSII